jgi:threonyl-tRNA synthetase
VLPWAETVMERLRAAGLRASLDRSGDRLGKLIRNGEQMKIPVLAVIGAKEVETESLSLRTRRQGDLGSVPVEALIEAARRANSERAASLPMAEESLA